LQDFEGLNSFAMADSKETKPCLCLIEYSPRQRFLVKEYGLKMDFHIGPDRKLRLFLRTHHGSPFTLAFHGVDALTLTEIKYGNIVFDLVLRNSLQLTTSDIEALFDVKPDTQQAADVLKAKSGAGLQLLEIILPTALMDSCCFRRWSTSVKSRLTLTGKVDARSRFSRVPWKRPD